MADRSRLRWKRFLVPGLMTVVCLWLAHGAITTGIAAAYENDREGMRALVWRADSPAALALEAAQLARDDQKAAAGKLARQALPCSCLSAVALRVLGLSASVEGRADEAQRLLDQAGRINPRDDEVQGWLLDRAVARADYPRAVLHADTLMRSSPLAQTPVSFLLASLLGNGQARGALVQRLSLDPPWRRGFLSIAIRAGADADVAALLQALRHAPSPATDEEVSPFFQHLVADEQYREAKTYFDGLVGQSDVQAPLIYDGDFAGRPGPAPLNWQALTGLGSSARWMQDDGAPMGELRLSHDGFSSSGPLVRQLILLPPGAYEVAARTRVEDPLAARRFNLQITCTKGSRIVSMVLPGAPGRWLTSRARFSVPAEACDAQWLQITPVTVDRREMADMSVDDIVVRAVATAPAPLAPWMPAP